MRTANNKNPVQRNDGKRTRYYTIYCEGENIKEKRIDLILFIREGSERVKGHHVSSQERRAAIAYISA
jgi:hypothetical protein